MPSKKKLVPAVRPSVLVRAAELLDEHEAMFACFALRGVGRELIAPGSRQIFDHRWEQEVAPECDFFHHLYFKDRERQDCSKRHGYFTAPKLAWAGAEDRAHRIFALLLAAEIARTGGL